MDAKKLAARLDGRQMGSEITEEEEALAREAGLVVVFGCSDDNVELMGAIDAEVPAYNGTAVYLGPNGLLVNGCDDDRCPYFLRERERAPRFKAKWNDGDGAAWSYEVPWPHETFRVMEDGDLFCVGVVFALADVPAPRSDGR